MPRAAEYQHTTGELFPEKIIRQEELTQGTYLLEVGQRFPFLSGQVVKVAVDGTEPPRIYSICNGNNQNRLQILYTVKEDGYLTPRLALKKPGDIILISRPYGGFTGNDQPAWWIAAGTGIAPFHSMLQSGMISNKKLIHGAGYARQFYFKDEFMDILGSDYIRCCSREKASFCFHGRVTDYLQDQELPPDMPFFICGKALMVVEVRDRLISKGIDYDAIIAEIYF